MKFFSKFLGPNKNVKQLTGLFMANTKYNEVEEFLIKQGKSFLTDLPEGEVIRRIAKKPWSRKKYIGYICLKQMIQVERYKNLYENESHLCDIPPIYNDFRIFMNMFSIFSRAQEFWEDWDDIAKLKIDALEEIFNSGELKGLFDGSCTIKGVKHDINYKAPLKYESYRVFCDGYDKRCAQLHLEWHEEIDPR